jgi:enoyl-CoA hydratase/carnithine racemase
MRVEQSETLAVSRTPDGVATLTLDNPPVNAISAPTATLLATAVRELAADDSVRSLVVTGAGARAFAAGADVQQFVDADTERGEEIIRAYRDMADALVECEKPSVASIRGFCLGGGLELALACDFRVAATDAQLGLPEITLGLLPGAGGTQMLPRLIGERRARLLYLTGEPISGEKAYRWGLVEAVAPAEDVPASAHALAAVLAGRSPHAVRTLKQIARETADLPLEDGLRAEVEGFLRCLVSADGREGVAAFLARREPIWAETA